MWPRKGLKMFEQVNVPIIGIIENMSGHSCQHCGEVSAIFKEGGGKKLAEKLDVPFLGKIPLDMQIMESGELGEELSQQSLKDGKKSPGQMAYEQVTENLLETLKNHNQKLDEFLPLGIGMNPETGYPVIVWNNDKETTHSPYDLRVGCPCASCVDENTGQRILDPSTIDREIKVNGIQPVGRYGISVQFSDGHRTGIYKFKMLKGES